MGYFQKIKQLVVQFSNRFDLFYFTVYFLDKTSNDAFQWRHSVQFLPTNFRILHLFKSISATLTT